MGVGIKRKHNIGGGGGGRGVLPSKISELHPPPPQAFLLEML